MRLYIALLVNALKTHFLLKRAKLNVLSKIINLVTFRQIDRLFFGLSHIL